MPFTFSINDILAEYFDIDRDKIELEKRAMLGYMHAMNERSSDPG